MDSLSQSWRSETLPYLHPPTHLIPQVLQKIIHEQIIAVAVIPFWPNHSWWSLLYPLTKKHINLGPSTSVLIKGPSMDPKLDKLPPGDLLMCLLSSKL
jgi:hypothetical protein